MSSRLRRFRSAALLAAGVLLFVGIFQLAELLVGGSESPSQVESPQPTLAPGEPIPIEVRRLGEHAYRIEVGGLHASTVRLAGEETGRIDGLVNCVNDRIEQARKDGTLDDRPDGAWLVRQAARHRLSEQVSSINSQCMNEPIVRGWSLRPLPPVATSRPEPAPSTEAESGPKAP